MLLTLTIIQKWTIKWSPLSTPTIAAFAVTYLGIFYFSFLGFDFGIVLAKQSALMLTLTLPLRFSSSVPLSIPTSSDTLCMINRFRLAFQTGWLFSGSGFVVESYQTVEHAKRIQEPRTSSLTEETGWRGSLAFLLFGSYIRQQLLPIAAQITLASLEMHL